MLLSQRQQKWTKEKNKNKNNTLWTDVSAAKINSTAPTQELEDTLPLT